MNSIINTNIPPKGLKPQRSAVDNFLYFYSIQTIKLTINKLTELISQTDCKSYFMMLSSISHQNVNYENFAPFIDNMNKFKSLDKCVFFYYDNSLLVRMSEIMNFIYTFNPSGRIPRSLTLKSYKDELISKGFFVMIESMANVFEENGMVNFSNKLLEIQQIDYELNETIMDMVSNANVDIEKKNINYIKNIKTKIDELFLLVQQPRARGGYKKQSIKGGATPEEINNLLDNTYNTITDEFVKLCASLGEISKQIQNSDYRNIILNNEIIQNVEDKKIEIEIEINNFLENYYNSIKIIEEIDLNQRRFVMGREASQISNLVVNPTKDVTGQVPLQIFNGINKYARGGAGTKRLYSENENDNISIKDKIIENYMSMCLYFACLYINEIPENYNTVVDIFLNGNYDLFQNDINYLNYKEFIKYLLEKYCTNYLLPDNYLKYIKYDNINIKLLISFCLKLKNERGLSQTRIIYIIFLFYQNYLKYIIKKTIEKKITGNELQPIMDGSYYGYYPGIINDFNNDNSTMQLFNNLKIRNLFNRLMNLNNKNIESENKYIFDNFSYITYHLMIYIYNPEISTRLLNEQRRTLSALRNIGGSKKIKKSKKNIIIKRNKTKKYIKT